MLAQLINRECTLYIASGSVSDDDYGNETDDLEPVATVCELQQRSREEHDDAVSDTDWTAFFLPDEDMGARPNTNKLVVDGHAYEFTGAPWEARNPRTQVTSHIEASLRWTGLEDGS